jgi:FAD/FMN-containing dehydrogenase
VSTVNDIAADIQLLNELRATTNCTVLGPGDDGYDVTRSTFNLTLQQFPAAIVLAESAADVQAAVRFAGANGHAVGIKSAGHGAHRPCDGDILISVAGLQGVEIDPERAVARIQAGTRWADVLPAAEAHGLTAIVGSSDGVSAVGYLLSGGAGLLSRKYGWVSETMVGAEIVTADGELRSVDADHEPELLWALRGSSGNFGVVTAVEVRLFPHATIFGGSLLFPPERAREVLLAYDAWTDDQPEEMGSFIALAKLPPPLAPPPFPDGRFVALNVIYAGSAADGERLAAPLRALGPAVDTLATIPASAIASIANDPTDPLPMIDRGGMVSGLGPAKIDALLAVAGPESDSVLPMVVMRHAGGQLARGTVADSPLAHPDAKYLMLAVGAVFSEGAADLVRAHLDRTHAALAPVGSGIPSLLGRGASEDAVRGSYDPAAWARLVALKAELDPDNVFRYNHNIQPD